MRSRNLFAAALIAAAALAAPSAHAQIGPGQMPGYATSAFEPSQRGSDWFANESNDYRGKFRLSLGAVGDYSYRSVIGAYNPDSTIAASLVRNQMIIHAGGNVVFMDRFRLGVDVPIQAFADGHSTTGADGLVYKSPLHEQSVGDIRATLDMNLAGTYGDPFTMAIGASVWFPVGQRESFDGDDVTRFEPHVNLAGQLGPTWEWSARAGYMLRPLRENYLDIRTGSELTFGGAIGLTYLDHALLIGPEVYGSTVLTGGDPFGPKDSPIEIMFGAHLKVLRDFRINAGAGTKLTNAYGAANARMLFGLEWSPDATPPDRDKDGIPDDKDACPDQAGPATNDPKTNGCPPPPPDADGDGIIDSLDACPMVPGVATNDPKTNGCPPDRDGDGILDGVDACPDVPGVKNDDPKKNGCPSDRDDDGIIDAQDACPDVKGIKTDDPKTNGCPDTDRDKDGILNDDDACPDEAGPKSNDPKTNGCPRVFIKGAQIQILEQPKFDFNKADIKAESDSLLTEVAKVMTDHPEIKKVRVEGHTDDKGQAAYNQKLSEQRAQSVVKWLTGHGIAAERLTAVGLGLTKPLVPNDSDANRALNRRVEFHIEDQAPTEKEGVKTQDGKIVPVPQQSPNP